MNLNVDVLTQAVGFPATEPQRQILRWLAAAPGEVVSGPLTLPPAASESLLLLGRGSGKTSLACLLGLGIAIAEERVEVVLAAPTLETSFDVLMQRLRDYLETPYVRREVRAAGDFLKGGTTKRQAVLRNGSTLTVIPSSARSVRGRGPKVVICDEVGEWPWESLERKDITSFLNAVRPRQAVQHGRDRKVVLLSTPTAAAGPLFQLYRKPPPEFALVRLPTYAMRPDIPRDRFEVERLRDPGLYCVEIECEWGDTEAGLIRLEAVNRAMRPAAGIPEPDSDHRVVIGVDLGLRRDFTGFTIMTRPARDRYVVHKMFREEYHGDVNRFLARLVEIQKAFESEREDAWIVMDQYQLDSVRELARRDGVHVREHVWGADRDGAFAFAAGLFEAGAVTLPESDAFRQEVAGLRVTRTKTGRRRIEHASSGHDDLLFSFLLCTEQLRNFNVDWHPIHFAGEGGPDAPEPGWNTVAEVTW